jgi:hypothetical protein
MQHSVPLTRVIKLVTYSRNYREDAVNSRMKNEPPWEFLLSASRVSLQSFELSRLTYAANVRKEIIELLDVWLEETSSALLARWLMQHRDRMAQEAVNSRGGELQPKAVRAASDNCYAEAAMPVPRIRNAT